MMGQKMAAAATPPPMAGPPSLPKPPVLNAPAMPVLPVLARPTVPVLAAPVMVVPAAPPVPVMRPVTVATVTRNLQAALGPEPQPGTPTTQGFPGFVSRNFNQVSQHQPTASSANMLNNLASMFNQAAPAAPERRQAARPLPPARPNPAPALEAKATIAPKLPLTAPQAPAQLKKADPPKPLELPKPAVAAQPASQPKPQPKAEPKPEPKAAEKLPQAQPPLAAKAPALARPALELPKPAVLDLPTAKPLPQEEEKKPQLQTPPGAPPRQGKPAESKLGPKSAEIKTVEIKAVESKVDVVETPKSETKAPAAETKAAGSVDQARQNRESKNHDRMEVPGQASKASPPQTAPPLGQSQKVEKMAQTRPENSELKVGEVQRQQINNLQAPTSREQLELARQTGAGLSAGGGGGNGGGGGQQRQQRRDQDGDEVIEELGGAESLGGDEQVQWWHLRGCEENVRMLSSELREAIFNLRTPERKLGVQPRQVHSHQRLRRQELTELPQTVVEQEQKPQQQLGDQVRLESQELCRACGHDLKGVDARRCPYCVSQAALQTLALLEADPHFIAYRVFLTVCRQPVASQAVYRLRDFTRLPSGAYHVQAA